METMEIYPFLVICSTSILFLCEVSAATFLTVGGAGLERKEKRGLAGRVFPLCLAGELLLAFLGSWFLNLSDHWILNNLLKYLWLFLCSLIPFFVRIKASSRTIIISGVCGYLMQHAASQIMQMFWSRASYAEMTMVYPAGKVVLIYFASELCVYTAVYAFLYSCFFKNRRICSLSKKAEDRFLKLSAVTMLVILGLSSARDHYAEESQALMLISRFLSVFCCLLILYLRSWILSDVARDAEMETVQRLRRMDHDLYLEKKETVALINQKCHDMRHQIARWENRGMVTDPEELEKMRELIRIYDASIQTGSETLDVLLTDRKLVCEQKQIHLNAIVDGRRLGFISEGDLCSLFGNLLENAMEAVSSLPEGKEKLIRLQVEDRHGMIIISEDNPFEGELAFTDGLLPTTKEDPDYHGYGIRSMRMIAEKYGGQMNIRTEPLFHVGILIPIPPDKT